MQNFLNSLRSPLLFPTKGYSKQGVRLFIIKFDLNSSPGTVVVYCGLRSPSHPHLLLGHRPYLACPSFRSFLPCRDRKASL